MRIKSSYAIAALLAVLLIGWLWSGQFVENGTVAGDEAGVDQAAIGTAGEAAAEAPMSVRVKDLVAETIEREVVANGKTAPVRVVQIRAETGGRVIEIGRDEGDRVVAGDLLVRLDSRDREVAVLEAEAVLRQRKLELEAAERLGEKGFQAETDVAQAEAYYAAAQAALKRAKLDLDHTEIRAPFAGVLEHRSVEIGDFVDIGDPIATVLDQNPFLVIGDVIETEVGRLEVGMTGVARLATGETVSGRVRYVASQADEQTRTFDIELEVPNAGGRQAVGVSAELRIAVETVLAHRVSPSTLTLSDEGVLGVKTVDTDDVVVFQPVQIARADKDQVWLTGLPKRIRLITVGQGFVRDGSKVQPVPTSENAIGPVISEAVQ
jgi:multidrug efflux system membrane fusion protein